MKVTILNSEEYNEFYSTYINNIPKDQTLGVLLEENKTEILQYLKNPKVDNLNYRYANGKWTIAEVMQHLIDVERIFQYRALSIAREPGIVLPGFNHDAYVPASEAGRRSKTAFEAEFTAVRNSTIALYHSFSEEMLKQTAVMDSTPTSSRAIGFIILGHTRHHLKILRERY